MIKKENQHIEWKSNWRDEYLRAGYIESWGRGTINMVEHCKKAGLPEPIFENKWGGVTVIFIKNDGMRPWENGSKIDTSQGSQKGSQKSSQKIIDLITENKNITTTEMANFIGISRRAVAKQIEKLKSEGKIKRIGPDKGGHWMVVKK